MSDKDIKILDHLKRNKGKYLGVATATAMLGKIAYDNLNKDKFSLNAFLIPKEIQNKETPWNLDKSKETPWNLDKSKETPWNHSDKKKD